MMRIKPKRRTITPTEFFKEFTGAVGNDPGSENKAMLFYLDNKEIGFQMFTSEARCTVLHFTSNMRTDDIVIVEPVEGFLQ